MAAIKLKVGGRVRLYRKDQHIDYVGTIGTVVEIDPEMLVVKDWVWVQFPTPKYPLLVSIHCLAHA